MGFIIGAASPQSETVRVDFYFKSDPEEGGNMVSYSFVAGVSDSDVDRLLAAIEVRRDEG